jgi:sugar phosphate isomerase/epimerase
VKIGCAAWLFSPMDRSSLDEEAITTIAELGFDGIELILRQRSELDTHWTPDRIARVRGLLGRLELTLTQFVVRWEVVAGFADTDPSIRQPSLEYFERACQLAGDLGTTTICTISPWPSGVAVPSPSPPGHWHPDAPGWERRTLKLQFPERFDWDVSWHAYVDSIRRVAAMARAHGLRFALENHTNAMTPHSDSLLRLFDHVDDPALGANLDVGFSFIQRESIPWAIYKLKDRLFHVHARDGDGLSDYLQPVGAGILDWQGIVRALHEVGYQGFISMEWPRRQDNRTQARSALEHLREQIARMRS